MAKRRVIKYQPHIEAVNGLVWSRQRASVVSSGFNKYVTTYQGVTYELERRGGMHEAVGWYLYSIKGSTYFFGTECARNLLPAVDEASELIVKADQHGEEEEG